MGITGFLLIDISFLNFTVWDVLDIVIVAYLIYRIYKLLQGSIAFSIFLGLFTLYIFWYIVNALHMQLVSNLLSQFASVGVILLIIVFQPELRKFLLDVGQSTFGTRLDPLKRWLNIKVTNPAKAKQVSLASRLLNTVRGLQKSQRDAVFILNSGDDKELKYNGGLTLDTEYNRELVDSILLPESNLKQGAIIIEGTQILAVGAKFPHSEREDLPEGIGMRHRLGLGATENADVGAIIISESDGSVSTAYQGYLAYGVSDQELKRFITAHTETVKTQKLN
jgi:DNA integrity scanning protein DisA with diadenylate cyclase activity